MDENQKFNQAIFLIPSFVYIIGVGIVLVIVQLLMIYLKTGKGVMNNVDTPTIVYTILTGVILLLSVIVPLIAYSKRKKQALVSIEFDKICIQEKALKSATCFQRGDIVSLKLFVSPDEKRSSMRLELKSGQVVMLQLMYVVIAAEPFKEFMKAQGNLDVQDW